MKEYSLKQKISALLTKSIQNLPVKHEGNTFEISVGDTVITITLKNKEADIRINNTQDLQVLNFEAGEEKFFTGQKGLFKILEGCLKQISDKRSFGQLLSSWKSNVNSILEEKRQQLNEHRIQEKIAFAYPEATLAVPEIELGYEHFLNKVQDEMLAVFQSMGYTPVYERELEDEYHNFEALNIDAGHPAREDHDSFYVGEGQLLRTHTSTAQIRNLEKLVQAGGSPPIAIVSPGVCYRRDAVDATHFPVFRQMEGLVVDKNIGFADLKGTLIEWAKAMFGSETKIRLRPDYFPFTEPSAELSVSSPEFLGGRWIELLGCGMVHPQVLRNVGLDPEIWRGFAFGTGVERIAMIRYGINDIRLFTENDIRFLKQSL